MSITYILYYSSSFSRSINNYSAELIILSMVTLNIIVSILINKHPLEYDLSYKEKKTKLKKRLKIYFFIPACISFQLCFQVISLSLIFRNIAFYDEKANILTITILIIMLYIFFILTMIPGIFYIKMDNQKSLMQKTGAFISVSLAILLLLSTTITVLPVIFTHSVITLSGISDFSVHNYIIKTSKYPEKFFSNTMWSKKTIKPGEYYSIHAVSMFTTNQFLFLCPEEIIKSYRESWKFNPLNTAKFDSELRQKLQKEAAYCVPVQATAVKRWDVPIQ
ncbi:hypothetical protein E4N01_20040 [Salmonella enterica]|nr:hypothetical protein [Salmonella enterica]